MTQPQNFTSMTSTLDVISPELLSTSGHNQVVVRCPRCTELHRHTGLGLRRSPCGCTYFVGVLDPVPGLVSAA